MGRKTVLVTGATGFIGRRLLPLLVEVGYDVVALSRKPQQVEPGVRPVAIDLLEPGAVQALIGIEQPQALVHLAWCTEHGAFWESSDNHRWVDVTLRMAKAFAEHGGKHFVGAGSCAEYVWNGASTLLESDTGGEPATLYGLSKKLVFERLKGLFADTPVTFNWGRVFFIYGFGEGEKKFISSAINAYASNSEFSCQNPLLVRDFIYVDDVATAFCKMLATDGGGVYNVGSGKGVALGHVVMLVAHAFDAKTPLFEAASDQTDSAVVADIQRASALLGFAPSFTLEKGIRAHIRDQLNR